MLAVLFVFRYSIGAADDVVETLTEGARYRFPSKFSPGGRWRQKASGSLLADATPAFCAALAMLLRGGRAGGRGSWREAARAVEREGAGGRARLLAGGVAGGRAGGPEGAGWWLAGSRGDG